MNKNEISTIAVISDVSVGYGTPQIISIAKSLSQYFDAQGIILEPDQPERPPSDLEIERIDIKRFYTSTHPYALSGRYDYCLQVAQEIDKLKPDIIVLAAFVGAGALLTMKHKPKLIIYYGLEHTDGTMWRELELMPLIAPMIDIAIFPEEMRAQLDAPRLKLEKKPILILYNGSSSIVENLPASKRNGRLFYGGLIHPDLTYGDWYMDGDLDKYPIDMFGLIDGYEDKTKKLEKLATRASRISYNGYVKGGSELLNILRSYQFSIVAWTPVRESFKYAAPNKFFDAIQAGVPIISAPHPMCKRLVERYGCGYIMEDWTLDAMKDSLSEASLSILRGEYSEIIEKNIPIAQADLCWDKQFEKVAHFLDHWDNTQSTKKGSSEKQKTA